MGKESGLSKILTLAIAAGAIIVLIVCGFVWYGNSVRTKREAEMDRTAKAFKSSNDKMTDFWNEVGDNDKAYEMVDDGLWGAWMSANDEGLKTFTSKADKEIAKRRKTLDEAGAEIRSRKQLIADMNTAADDINSAPGFSKEIGQAAKACVEIARGNNKLDEEIYDLKRQLIDIDASMVKEYKAYLAGKKGEEDVSAALKEAITQRNNIASMANKTRAARIEDVDIFSADWKGAN